MGPTGFKLRGDRVKFINSWPGIEAPSFPEKKGPDGGRRVVSSDLKRNALGCNECDAERGKSRAPTHRSHPKGRNQMMSD